MIEIDRFTAITTGGAKRVIVEYQHSTTFVPLKGATSTLPGSTELFTDDGLDVTQNGDGTYTVLQTDEILRRCA